jgi:hypothetical protein
MKKRLFQNIILISALLLSYSFAVSAEIKDSAWIKQQALKAASQYANSISCETLIEENNLLALIPWNNVNDLRERAKAEYALIWHGDIGCDGGTGTFNPYIAIINIGSGNSFVVNPLMSSPVVKFDVQVHRINGIIKYSKTELLLSGKTWGPDDGHCCPSIPVNILLTRDTNGNWLHVKTIKK